MPSSSNKHQYSLNWGGNQLGDNFLDIWVPITSGKNVPQMIELMRSFDDGYKGNHCNLVLADTEGNIGYMMLSQIPDRKDKTEFVSNRVLNGETTEFDWKGWRPSSELPYLLNPEKGYIVTANNRVLPETSATDFGASMT